MDWPREFKLYSVEMYIDLHEYVASALKSLPLSSFATQGSQDWADDSDDICQLWYMMMQ